MASDHEPDERAALVQYRFLDHLGRTLKNESIGKAESSVYGYFDYLPRTPVDAVSSQVVFTPESATKLHIGFRRYKPSGDRPVSLEHVEMTPLGKRFAFPKYDVDDRLPPRTATRLAVVADTFTLDALSRQCQVLPLSGRVERRNRCVRARPSFHRERLERQRRRVAVRGGEPKREA